MFKSGFVTIIGRANVGKSTLINAITGEKVSIISHRPQTTRNNVRAIVTTEDYQIVLIDTPGIHKPKNRLGEFMMQAAMSTLDGVDAIVYVYDVTVSSVRDGDMNIIEMLKEVAETPKFLVLNKIDLVPKEKLLGIIDSLSKLIEFKAIIPISAAKNQGVDIVINEIVNVLPEGPKYYDENIITDSTVREISAEIIREKILQYTNEEVPHGIGVEIIQFAEPKRENGVYTVQANIYCEKETHKGILIGKQGSMLKRIGQSARIDIERMLGGRVNLKLWVKVKEDWRNSQYMLKELGYKD